MMITYYLQGKITVNSSSIYRLSCNWYFISMAWYIWINFWGLSMMTPNTTNKRQQNKVPYPPWEIQKTCPSSKENSCSWLLSLHFLVATHHISPHMCIRLVNCLFRKLLRAQQCLVIFSKCGWEGNAIAALGCSLLTVTSSSLHIKWQFRCCAVILFLK